MGEELSENETGDGAEGEAGLLLSRHGVSRRALLGFCSAIATMLALPPERGEAMAAALAKARRPSVIWLSFQECTGCTEALTRSHSPSLENLILDALSLDYHHTLQAASGSAAERARKIAQVENKGKYLLVVDGSVPTGNPGFSTIAGISNLAMLKEVAADAAAVICVGTCAAFGGVAAAAPNPTGAVPISKVITDKPIINIPGCPPIPVVMTAVLAHVLAFGKLPELDALKRPAAFYGQTIHDRCYRRPFYDRGQFAETFDDEGARKGWCLFKLGCRGPITHNSCATTKWNDGVSFPIEAGHGCLGCSEPNFWDGGGFYRPLSAPFVGAERLAAAAAVVGVGLGAASGASAMAAKRRASAERLPVTLADLETGKPKEVSK